MKMIRHKFLIIAMAVVAAAVVTAALPRAFVRAGHDHAAIEQREAFRAGSTYGQRAGEVARSRGQEGVTIDDASIDALREALTAGKYAPTREQFIEGFRHGYAASKPAP